MAFKRFHFLSIFFSARGLPRVLFVLILAFSPVINIVQSIYGSWYLLLKFDLVKNIFKIGVFLIYSMRTTKKWQFVSQRFAFLGYKQKMPAMNAGDGLISMGFSASESVFDNPKNAKNRYSQFTRTFFNIRVTIYSGRLRSSGRTSCVGLSLGEKCRAGSQTKACILLRTIGLHPIRQDVFSDAFAPPRSDRQCPRGAILFNILFN